MVRVVFAFVLILMIMFFGTGCTDFHGDYHYEIVNEYEIWRDSIGPQISEPYGTVSGDMFIEEFGVYKQYIYGDSYRYGSRNPLNGYFVIDTQQHALLHLASRSKLEDELKVLGLNRMELREPYDFLLHRWKKRVLYFALFGASLALLVWFTYRRHKANLVSCGSSFEEISSHDL